MPKNTSAKVAIGFFTIFFQCALHSLTNSIQFALVINTTDKSFNNQMIESIYAELKDNILCQPPIIDPDNIMTLILFTKDIFTADAILKTVESFTGVDRVELFALTDTTSYDEWIAREVDKKLNKKTAQDSNASFSIMDAPCISSLILYVLSTLDIIIIAVDRVIKFTHQA